MYKEIDDISTPLDPVIQLRKVNPLFGVLCNDRFFGSIYWDWLLSDRLSNYTVIPHV